MQEEWRDVIGYEGLYQVSNLGRVRSLDRYACCKNNSQRLIKGRVLAFDYDKDGYPRVCLSNNGKHITVQVHRLVAQAFLPNPDNLPCINHKDECITNNRVDNLEWCTYKYNNNYGTHMEKINKNRTDGLFKAKKVGMYSLEGKLLNTFKSVTAAAKYLNKSYNANISSACRGNTHTAYGYIWKYLD